LVIFSTCTIHSINTTVDIKPENLLVDLTTPTKILIKVADFGLARSISTQPPFTHYVSTRWYRAPEVILHSPTYGPLIDLWAVGLILWELYTLRPLFPGNSEVDQIYKIGELLGSMEYSWEEGVHLMKLLNLGLNTDGVGRVERSVVEERIYRDVKRRDAASLICGMVRWNPEERLDVHDALGHEYFGKTASADVGSKVGFVNSRLWSTFKRVPAINSNTVVNPNQVCDGLSGKFAAVQSQSSIFDKGNDESSNFQIMPESEMASRLSLDTMPTQNECGSSRFKSRPSIEQPNEFCEYLNAIASSTDCADEHQGCRSGLIPRLDASDVAAAQQIDSRGGPLQPKFTPSARYRPRAMLSDSSPYIPMLRSVAQTISRSKRRGRQSINKSNRRRSSEKPRWLLSNQNMSKRAIEVQIGHSSHALEAGEDNFGSRYFQESARQAEPIMEEHQADSVWNPF
jgi:serine/threonine protein kinase